MPLDLAAPLAPLRGASYNPRHIGDDDLSALKASLAALGVVKPLIARGDLLVAGHQRTRALRELGVTHAPVFRLSAATTLYDEIRFNQLHNGTDLDAGDEAAAIAGGFDRPGWHTVEPRRVTANMRGRLAGVRKEICELVTAFGPWGACVATQEGEVIHAAQYALAAYLTRTPLTVCVVPPEREAIARAALARGYGVFSYDGIERRTYHQTFAQMRRLRNGPHGKGNRSTLYETHVLPWLAERPAARLLDFGAGQGDYAAALRRRGVAIHDVELFRRTVGREALDGKAVHAMIDRLCADLRAAGGYDAVVLDSVLNSVDSLKAEAAVLACVNAFCRPGGSVFLSGRLVSSVTGRANQTRDAGAVRIVEFLDRDGFTAIYRKAQWFFQKYHTLEQVAAIADRAGFRIDATTKCDKLFQVRATKVRALPPETIADAVAYEFDLPFGPDARLGRVADVSAALAAAQERDT